MRNYLRAFTCAALVTLMVVGCSSTAVTTASAPVIAGSASMISSPVQGNPASSPSASSSPQDAATGMPSTPEIVEEATPTPTAPTLEAVDLADGFVTVADLTRVQGSTFRPRSGGILWAQDVPLTKKHAWQIKFGLNAKTKPLACAAVAAWLGDGFLRDDAKQSLVPAAAYSNFVNATFGYGTKLGYWIAVAYLMRPGTAGQWQINAQARSRECENYKTISKTGDIVTSTSERRLTSGSAIISAYTKGHGGSYWMSEAIGDVLYTTFLALDTSLLARASAVYNKRANRLAALQGVTRTPINLRELTRLKSTPSTFVDVPISADSTA